MKYCLIVFGFLFLFSGCGDDSAENEMRLTGEVRGLRKGDLWLQRLDDTAFVTVDSMRVDGDSAFQFSEILEEPEVYYLTMSFQDSSNVIKRIPFFAEPGEINLRTSLKNFESDLMVNGSVNQKKWDEYKELMTRFNNQNLELIEEELNAMKEGDDSLLTAIKKQQERLLKNTYLASVNFAKNNSDYEIAPYIMLTEVYDLNLRFLDTIHTSLSAKIKNSKYGKELESWIVYRNHEYLQPLSSSSASIALKCCFLFSTSFAFTFAIRSSKVSIASSIIFSDFFASFSGLLSSQKYAASIISPST
jgi:hypothetical protein